MTTTAIHVAQAQPLQRWSGLILRLDGLFLMVAGGVSMILEVLGHFWNLGPYAQQFATSPYTIGFFEAHGLAFIISLCLFWVAPRDRRPFWHGLAAIVHILLGGANIAFFLTFVAWGFVPMGIGVTVVHGVFVVANLYAYWQWKVADNHIRHEQY